MGEPTTGHSRADCRGVTSDNENPLSLQAGAALNDHYLRQTTLYMWSPGRQEKC